MRYKEIGIRTLRDSPSAQRSRGRAMLVRAGYLGADGEPTRLGARVIERLQALARSARDLWNELGLEVRGGSTGTKLFLAADAETEVLTCAVCGYGAPADFAKAHSLADPVEEMLPREQIATPDCNTIDSLAAFLGVSKAKTAKAMMYAREGDSRLVFVVIRGDARISESKLRRVLGALKPATPEQIIAAGAAPGYASPVGLNGAFVVADQQIPNSRNLAAGANHSGFHLININYGRDFEADLVADLALADAGDPCAECGHPLYAARGYVLADDGNCLFRNVMLAIAARYHDDRGLTWPPPAAAFDAHLLHLAAKDVDTMGFASELYEQLEASGLSILFDDRDERAGVKFFDADLIGLPLRLTVGSKNLAEGLIEIKARRAERGQLVPAQEAVEAIRAAARSL